MFASLSENGSSPLCFRFVVVQEDARDISCRFFLLRYRALRTPRFYLTSMKDLKERNVVRSSVAMDAIAKNDF